MKNLVTTFALALLLAACGQDGQAPAPEAAQAPAALKSGVDVEGMDKRVRPQDDYFRYANGKWLETAQIPADQVGWGSYMTLHVESLKQVQTIVEELGDVASSETAVKIRNYYNAYMDEARVEELGFQPIDDLFAQIDALEDHAAVARWMGEHDDIGVGGVFGTGIGPDDKDSTKYVIFMSQGGIGLPDREYYFDDSERGTQLRDGYQDYMATVLGLSGYEAAADAAARIMDLETAIATLHWSKEDSRDADKIYNKLMDDELGDLLSNFDLDAYFSGLGTGRQPYVIVSQPSFFESMNDLFVATDVNTWKEFLRLRTINAFSSMLPKSVVDTQFEFFNKTLFGSAEQQPRAERAVLSLNGNIGELLGQLYVEKHFPPEAKARMNEMVHWLVKAYEDSIRNLDWMTDETKAKALDKLAKFTPKIGYPDKWKDYSALETAPDSLIANVRNARRVNHYREVDKLGKPIDRTEWFMPPQTVNAYFYASLNEIVFPAAYLQPPNFQLDADDAFNYGAAGITIGHEIGHGFDDQGSKYDGDGNLNDWWTEEDRARFEERTAGLIEQYNRFEALPGVFVNGEFTLGENIGDLGGTAIALKAYRMSLQGKEPPVIDGFTAEERFFLGMAQTKRILWRDQFIELLIKSDPHSPDEYRVNGVVSNVDAFYETYKVTEGDKLHLPPEQRVRIWN
jgi:predicted metalloendopeptidase